MHTFQPYPMSLLEWNPWEKISKEWFALTTELDGRANAMTASWGGIAHIWDRNVVMTFVRDSRYTKEILDQTEFFSACFFDPNEKSTKSTLKFLASVSGRQEDKLAEWKLDINHQMGVPFIDQANFAILCKKIAAVPITEDSMLLPEIPEQFYKEGNYHTMYIGEILDILAR